MVIGNPIILGGGGGGGGEAFAAISVTYPEGSICTCSQTGQDTLTAGDTTGAWLFVVPAGGTWTITSTDIATGETAVANVVIENQYEMKSAVLSYWTNQLYEDGNEFVSVTGGWGTRAWRGAASWRELAPTLVKNADHMEISWDNGGVSSVCSGVVEILKDFDFTNYSRVEITLDTNIATGGYLYYAVVPRDANTFNDNAKATANLSSGTRTDYVTSLNISTVTGSYDFILGTRCTSGTHNAKIKKVLLF